MKTVDIEPEVEPEITWRQRPSETISLSLPLDALASMTKIAESHDLSLKALLKFYIGQGLRVDLERQRTQDELKPEYDFDDSQSQPNRFAARMNERKTVIELEPDVAAVFQTNESVNAVLRALLATMPQKAA